MRKVLWDHASTAMQLRVQIGLTDGQGCWFLSWESIGAQQQPNGMGQRFLSLCQCERTLEASIGTPISFLFMVKFCPLFFCYLSRRESSSAEISNCAFDAWLG